MDEILGAEGIKKLRLAKGLTQAQFAELLRCSPMTVRRWEAGVVPKVGVLIYELQMVMSGKMDAEIEKMTTRRKWVFKNYGFALFLKELRKERGLTQRALAARCSGDSEPPFISQDYIAQLEMGFIMRPSPAKLEALARGLGMTVAELEGANDKT